MVERMENNMANNYKDAAQEYLVEYEAKFKELVETGKLSEKQKEHYDSLLGGYQVKMIGFTHKDQKPFWT